MRCKNCGKELPNEAKFCSACGTAIEVKPLRKFCIYCGTELLLNDIFCYECGRQVSKLSNSDNTTIEGPCSETSPKREKRDSDLTEKTEINMSQGVLLFTHSMFTLYRDEPTVGVSEASGTLRGYDNRIEFEKKSRNTLGNVFGSVGKNVARDEARKDQIITYPLTQVIDIRTGKYSGVYNSLVIVLKNGDKWSFVHGLPDSQEPQNIVDNLKPYIKK